MWDKGNGIIGMGQTDAAGRIGREGQRNIVLGGDIAIGGFSKGQVLFNNITGGIYVFDGFVKIINGLGTVAVQKYVGAECFLVGEPFNVVAACKHFLIYIV